MEIPDEDSPFDTPTLTYGVPWSKDDPDRIFFRGPYIPWWRRLWNKLSKTK